jgi:hypothetical protein
MARRIVFGLLPIVVGLLSTACADSFGPSSVERHTMSAAKSSTDSGDGSTTTKGKRSPGGSAGGLKKLPVH